MKFDGGGENRALGAFDDGFDEDEGRDGSVLAHDDGVEAAFLQILKGSSVIHVFSFFRLCPRRNILMRVGVVVVVVVVIVVVVITDFKKWITFLCFH